MMTVISLDAARQKRRRLEPVTEESRAAAALDGFAAGYLPFTDVLQALVAPFQDPLPAECVRIGQRL
ncbi:hypothetical protein LJR219_002440 [Phenylobacterium sp. LjRoot219]|uniref:hypothetical protein n=1 Tax=Phenylobacterium sp. LjRoot219 TaxID=3342283 RepID=UPI003ECDD6AE